MLRRIILIFCILIFSSVLWEEYGLPGEPPYVIRVESPIRGEDVERELDARGRVIISRAEKMQDDMLLVSLIRPATYPRYYFQSQQVVLRFKEGKARREADWEVRLVVGDPGDFGKKFYVYFLLIGRRSLSEIQRMDKMTKEEGIGREEFESNFLSYSNKYYTSSESIPVYRKFPEYKMSK